MHIRAHAPVRKVEADKPAPKTSTVNPTPKKDTPKTRRVTLSVIAEPGHKIYLAGTFNKWNPTDKEMIDIKGDGIYCATVQLPEGSHQYKFVIDGTWCADPECADRITNKYGTHNSVINV